MPFYLSLATFLMSLSFSVYGVFKDDPFLYVSNLFDCFLHITYNVLFFSICIVTLSRTHITLYNILYVLCRFQMVLEQFWLLSNWLCTSTTEVYLEKT